MKLRDGLELPKQKIDADEFPTIQDLKSRISELEFIKQSQKDILDKSEADFDNLAKTLLIAFKIKEEDNDTLIEFYKSKLQYFELKVSELEDEIEVLYGLRKENELLRKKLNK